MLKHQVLSFFKVAAITVCVFLTACQTERVEINPEDAPNNDDNDTFLTAVEITFDGRIDLDNLANYANQDIPNYIDEDNTEGNEITDAEATLGRVLFYDRNLSIDNTISCASCHQQSLAFSDPNQASTGVNGTTGRHSMRLVNARFSAEDNFFWDERAESLEEQTTQPIQDHVEMGFSGQDGGPDLDDLLEKLEGIDYYQELFRFVYGDLTVTEERIQNSIAQFIRSIQSFDSKYDEGRSQVQNNNNPFPNFTQEENSGKMLYMQNPQFNNNGVRIGGGLGCQRCHRAPEFDIVPNSRNNGVIGTITGVGNDLQVERSPSLRDLVNPEGIPNGPFMHTGNFNSIEAVLNHYNQINGQGNNNLDQRLRPNGNPQNLALTADERAAVIAFLETLTGSNIYTDPKWSDPFE